LPGKYILEVTSNEVIYNKVIKFLLKPVHDPLYSTSKLKFKKKGFYHIYQITPNHTGENEQL